MPIVRLFLTPPNKVCGNCGAGGETVKHHYLPKNNKSTEMSAGETPGILDA